MLIELLSRVVRCCKRTVARQRPQTKEQRRRLLLKIVFLLIVFLLLTWSTPLVPVSKLIVERLGIQCDQARYKDFVDQLCMNYTQGYIVGPLCPALCSSSTVPRRDDIRHLSIDRCLAHGNKIVLGMTMLRRPHPGDDTATGGEGFVEEPVVMKAKHFSGEAYRSHLDGPLGGITLKEALELLQDELGQSIKPQRVNESLVTDFLVRHHLAPADLTMSHRLSTAQLHTLWSLAAQEEFAMLLLMAKSEAMPELLGSCGHAYIVRSYPPPRVFNLLQSPHVAWRERVRTALGFIKLDERLATTPYGQLHLCDVQQGNFGIRPERSCRAGRENAIDEHGGGANPPRQALDRRKEQAGRRTCNTQEHTVDAIDVDITFFGLRMKDVMGQPRCDSDAECDFFDCSGWCDKWRRQCVDTRANNNMQAICSKIFIGVPRITGLLWNAPWRVRDKLQAALTECADITSMKDSRETAKEIRNILEEELRTLDAEGS